MSISSVVLSRRQILLSMPLLTAFLIVAGHQPVFAQEAPTAFGDPFASFSSESIQADLATGAATASVPITVPPGRNGIQPKLALAYSSQNQNGMCGVGWDLPLGYIQRSTKRGVPHYDAEPHDEYVVRFGGSNAELVEAASGEFHPKIEGEFAKYSFDGTSWEVRDKAGTVYTFGTIPASRITTSKGTFEWRLDRVTDQLGNYMTVEYVENQGQIYPSVIRYTGNDTTGDLPQFTVEFVYDDTRLDVMTSYRSGDPITTAWRLEEIKLLVQDVLRWRYQLSYTSSPDTNRSLLSSVTIYDAEGNSLPPKTFTYQQGGSFR